MGGLPNAWSHKFEAVILKSLRLFALEQVIPRRAMVNCATNGEQARTGKVGGHGIGYAVREGRG